MAQHTIDFPCTADTYIDAYVKSQTHGTDAYIDCGQLVTTFPTAGIYPRYALMKFNFASMPQLKRFVKLSLRVYAIQEISGPDAVFRIIKDTEQNSFYASWLESTNWNSVDPSEEIDFIDIGLGNIAYFKDVYHELEIPASLLQSSKFLSYGLWFRWMSENKPNDNSTMIFSSKEGTNPPVLRLVYEDVPPEAPTPIDPVGAYKDLKKVIRFQWSYNSSVGGVQKKYQLQWSADQDTWNTIEETTANTYCDVAEDTFPAGNIFWRIKTYNIYDESSDYSPIQVFYAVGAPDTPIITDVTAGTSRPAITWASFGQQFYRLQVLTGEEVIYDTGDTPSISDREHKVRAFLSDGAYNIRLRIRNEFGLYSDWSEINHAIVTTKPSAPTFTLQRTAYGVELNISNISSYGLVYRADKDHYICIGKVIENGSFTDNSVKSMTEYKYFIRSVSETETYRDSDVKFVLPSINYGLIAPVSNLENIFVMRYGLNNPPQKAYSLSVDGQAVYYSGRKHPVWEPSEHQSVGFSITFYLKSWSEVENLINICNLNEAVLYRDTQGRKIYGILNNLAVNNERKGYVVSCTINHVDYEEGLEV